MSDDSTTIELNTKPLDRLVMAFKGRIPVARVGILGKKVSRSEVKVNSTNTGYKKIKGSEAPQTNAEIGAKHEFGDGKTVIRSFLRVPLTEHLQAFLEKSGAFDKDSLKKVVREGSIRIWVEKMAGVAEQVIAEAFASGGFGKWKPSNMKNKKVQMTLVETQQLRNSITSEVK